MSACPFCGHAWSEHRHVRDGGCVALVTSRWPGRPDFRCHCTRAPGPADLDDPTDEVERLEQCRDADLKREENCG